MMSSIRPFRSPVVKSALVAFAATLLIGRSPDLQATGAREATVAEARAQAAANDAPESEALKVGESRVDALEVTSELVDDPKHPGRLAVRLMVRNPTEQEIVTRCLVVLEKNVGNPMARVAPAPSVAWQHTEELELAAQATITRDLPLPQAVSVAVQKARKAAELAEAKGVMLPRYVSYDVVATPKPRSTAQAGKGSPNRPRPSNPGATPSRASETAPQALSVRGRAAEPSARFPLVASRQ
jgi:hypothetical protein